MTFPELMGAIRANYVEVLAQAVASHAAFRREPVLRGKDGTPGRADGRGLPVRLDAVDADGESILVDAARQLRFDEFSFDLDGVAVSVAPFTWDWLGVEVSGEVQAAGDACEAWFMRWFDADDERTPDSEGLRGVVHFMGDFQPVDGGIAVRIDLGSCPDEALDDLLFSLAETGVRAVRLGA